MSKTKKDLVPPPLRNYYQSPPLEIAGHTLDYRPGALESSLIKHPNTNARIQLIPPYQINSGQIHRTLGYFDTITNEIKIDSSQPIRIMEYVLNHEIGHSQGLNDEMITDDYAQSTSGVSSWRAAA